MKTPKLTREEALEIGKNFTQNARDARDAAYADVAYDFMFCAAELVNKGAKNLKKLFDKRYTPPQIELEKPFIKAKTKRKMIDTRSTSAPNPIPATPAELQELVSAVHDLSPDDYQPLINVLNTLDDRNNRQLLIDILNTFDHQPLINVLSALHNADYCHNLIYVLYDPFDTVGRKARSHFVAVLAYHTDDPYHLIDVFTKLDGNTLLYYDTDVLRYYLITVLPASTDDYRHLVNLTPNECCNLVDILYTLDAKYHPRFIADFKVLLDKHANLSPFLTRVAKLSHDDRKPRLAKLAAIDNDYNRRRHIINNTLPDDS